MRYNKALLIYNGNAGQAEITENLSLVTGILSSEIKELTLLQTQAQGDAERYCREQGDSVDLLLIMGGDGTVHEAVNGLAGLDNPPPIGILPGGTCNDFARALELPLRLDQAAHATLAGKTRRLDIGRISYTMLETRQMRYFSNFYGIGLITEASENTDSALKGRFGKLSYFLSALQKIRETAPFQFRLAHEGGVTEGEAVMILAANGRFLGTNALPVDSQSLEDGRLDVFIVYEAGLPLLIELLSHKVSPSWDPQNSSIDYIQTRFLQIETDEPKCADTDGEIYQETPAELSVLPRHLTFLAGSPTAG